MPDDDSGFGIARGLKNLLSRDVKSDEEGGGEVIALAGHAAVDDEENPSESTLLGDRSRETGSEVRTP